MGRVAYLHPGQWPVYIGFTTDEAAFKREMKRLKVADAPPMFARERANATMHIFDTGGPVTYIITIMPQSRKVSKEQYAALIAHEALHVIQDMRKQLNSDKPFCYESESYLLQYIVQHCLQEAWNTGRVKRTKPC